MRVIIESPFAGGWQNVLYARQCVLDSLSRGESPYASHLLYAQKGMLDDRNSEERRRGIVAADGWLEVADYVAVYCDRGVTTGMLFGVIKGARLNKPFRLRWLHPQKEIVIDACDQDPRTIADRLSVHERDREAVGV